MNKPITIRDFNTDTSEEPEEVSIDSLFSDTNVFKILLTIAGKEYIVSVEELLAFKKDINSMSDVELDTYIEKTSSWIFTLVTANIDAKKIKRAKSLEFEKWKAKKFKSIKESQYKDRITDKGFISYLLSSPEADVYSSKMEEIDKLDLMIEKMDKLYEILNRRVEILRTIIRNRREVKGGYGRNFSV
jgi:hypothetical protein